MVTVPDTRQFLSGFPCRFPAPRGSGKIHVGLGDAVRPDFRFSLSPSGDEWIICAVHKSGRVRCAGMVSARAQITIETYWYRSKFNTSEDVK
jgi:hypothetical protein